MRWSAAFSRYQRTVGQVQKAFDMMCERVLSRTTQGEMLATTNPNANFVQ